MAHAPFVARPPAGRLTETGFCSWVAQALPGDRIEYHRGLLAIDRSDREIDKLAARVLWAFEQDLVDIVQRRADPDACVYIAIARRKPRRFGPGRVQAGDAR